MSAFNVASDVPRFRVVVVRTDTRNVVWGRNFVFVVVSEW